VSRDQEHVASFFKLQVGLKENQRINPMQSKLPRQRVSHHRNRRALARLPVISFGSKKDGETEKKHEQFVERMVARGYTERQVRRLVDWYMRVKHAG
jgi:predicted Ser/Thr protein kinase